MSVDRFVTATAGLTVAGIALFASSAIWATVTAVAAGSSSAAVTALILGSGLTLVLSVLLAAWRPELVPAGLVGGAVGLLLLDAEATLRSGPLQGPFGYANATAAFFVQAIVAALMVVVASRSAVPRVGGMVAAGAFVFVIFVTRSWTAAILLPLVVGITLLVERARGGRAAVVVSAGLFAAAVVLTIVLGASRLGSGGGAVGEVVGGTISQNRVTLWNEALSLMVREPVLGVGPGRFATASPTAASDADLRWAHNEFLQAGAESGLPGFLLTVSIFLWGFAALWLGQPSRLVVLASAGLAAVGIHASVDYVLHFPAVTLAAAAVVGTGLGADRLGARREGPVGEVEAAVSVRRSA